jgi:hypothetical protein
MRLLFTAQGDFTERQKVRSRIRLSADHTEFSATSDVEFFDLTGEPLRSLRTTTSARRIQVEAPDSETAATLGY